MRVWKLEPAFGVHDLYQLLEGESKDGSSRGLALKHIEEEGGISKHGFEFSDGGLGLENAGDGVVLVEGPSIIPEEIV